MQGRGPGWCLSRRSGSGQWGHGVDMACRGRHGDVRGGVVLGRGGTGACLGGAGDGVVRAGAVGRLGSTLVGRWWSRYGAHATCLTECRAVVQRRVREGEEARRKGLELGSLRGTVACSWTCWLGVLVPVWNK